MSSSPLVHVKGVRHRVAVSAMPQVAVPVGKLAEGHDFADNPDRRQLFIIPSKVSNKNLGTASHRLLEGFDIFPVLPSRFEKVGIKMGVSTVAVRKMIGPLGTQGDLNAFDGVKDQQAQFPVENIVFEYLIEVGARSALMSRVILFEGEQVGSKAIVVQVGEVMQGAVPVTNMHAA